MAGNPNGLLMAVSGATGGLGTNALWVSTDGGITWAQRNPSPRVSSIFFSNGLFYLDDNLSQYVSSDLTTFTTTVNASNDSVVAFQYIAGQYVLVGNSNNFIHTSPDGINWTYYGTAPFVAGTIIGSVRATSRLLAFIENGPSGCQVWGSTDGLSWSTRGYAGGSTFYAQACGYGNGRTIVAGYISASSPDKLYYSDDDGATWGGPVSLPFAGVGGQKKILYKNGVWIISGDQGVCRSINNGLTWTLITTGFTGSVWNLGAVSQSTFVIANYNSITDALKSSPA